MIPAGLESKRTYNYYDDSDEDDFDDEFDFGTQIAKVDNNQSYYGVEPYIGTQILRNPKYQVDNNQLIKIDSNGSNDKKNLVELNNNYYYDENQYILVDLKNAILNKNTNLVVELLDKHNLDVNVQLSSDWIPIMYAVQSGSFEITKLLIDRGADLSFTDDSYSVLMSACGASQTALNENNLLNIVELILNTYSDPEIEVNSCDKYYQTPLMYACRVGNHFLIDCLIRFSANLNAVDDKNWTSLSHACSKGHIKCVEKLLELDIDATVATNEFYFAHDLAEKNGHFRIRDLVKRYLKLKKFENSNNIDYILNEIEDSDNELMNEPSYELNKKKHDDIESFLDNMKLSYLCDLFKTNKINVKKLLSLNEKDLINIGVSDSTARELLLREIKNFHQKNWKSSTLVPIRNDLRLNCNEIIAIVNNISKYLDFMSTNVKFITSEAIDLDKEIFADNYLNKKFLNELKQTSINCDQLVSSINDLVTIANNEIKYQDSQPIDLIKPRKDINVFSSTKKIAVTTASLVGLGVCAGILLFKFRI